MTIGDPPCEAGRFRVRAGKRCSPSCKSPAAVNADANSIVQDRFCSIENLATCFRRVQSTFKRSIVIYPIYDFDRRFDGVIAYPQGQYLLIDLIDHVHFWGCCMKSLRLLAVLVSFLLFFSTSSCGAGYRANNWDNTRSQWRECGQGASQVSSPERGIAREY